MEILVISLSAVASIKFYLNEVAYQTQIPSDITTQLGIGSANDMCDTYGARRCRRS